MKGDQVKLFAVLGGFDDCFIDSALAEQRPTPTWPPPLPASWSTAVPNLPHFDPVNLRTFRNVVQVISRFSSGDVVEQPGLQVDNKTRFYGIAHPHQLG